MTEAEKEYKSKRKEIQQKLIKFATRIPVFMYLTDFREYSLKDVIVNLEPELFRKVTGLSISDFELLVSLNVFNSELMNDAVYKFKRYEDSSLDYTGIDTRKGTVIGGWDTAIEKQLLFPEKAPRPQVETVHREKEPHTKPQTEKAAPKVAWENLQAGSAVVHKTFGKGVVKSVDGRFIVVAFQRKESRFPHPWVFEQGYLSME